MSIDLDEMRDLVHDLYVMMVVQQHGDPGAAALKQLLAALHKIYRWLDPEAVRDRVVVFKALSDADHPLARDKAVRVQRPEGFAQHDGGPFVIQVLQSGEFLLWKQEALDLGELAAVAVVYEYSSRSEYFFAKGERRKAPKLDTGYASVFGIPAFSTLREALDAYRTVMARRSACEILKTTWFEENRLFLKTKPEATMRRSLVQFLASTLRDAEVRPEQIVDETHPVDVKVTWMLSNRLALIEIKWLGDSKDEATGKVTTTYRPSRARDGAKQLAEYLDANRERASERRTRGYLVVFDARRRGLAEEATDIGCDDGLHYADDEIEYDPKYHEQRGDFEEPVRFFVEPKCA
jgi:hypothetical protein